MLDMCIAIQPHRRDPPVDGVGCNYKEYSDGSCSMLVCLYPPLDLS